eukprot:TRINITY_DN11138_c0_g1_i22.p1 TRINITY_DN11138_c0_g1~~TRINITY_DN11138_c0_g1_i22.p1  ORF type:complete len:110 (+),score=20.09 TRINITY_DN11138_c0_g1_i22:101-430(+)
MWWCFNRPHNPNLVIQSHPNQLSALQQDFNSFKVRASTVTPTNMRLLPSQFCDTSAEIPDSFCLGASSSRGGTPLFFVGRLKSTVHNEKSKPPPSAAQIHPIFDLFEQT